MMKKKSGPIGAKRYWAPHLVPSNRAEPGPWKVQLVEPGESKVLARGREAYMPLPATRQDLMIARHELGHVQTGFTQVDDSGEELDPSGPVAAFSRMLQEPMVEAIATVQGFDIRQARDGLDFSGMQVPDPGDWYTLARMVLQYAYSVGSSENQQLRDYAAKIGTMLRAHPDRRVLEQAYSATVHAAELYGRDPKNVALRDGLGEIVGYWARVLAEKFGPEEKQTQPEQQTAEQQQATQEVVRENQKQIREDREAEQREAQQRQEDGKQEPPAVIAASSGVSTKITVHRHVTSRRPGKKAPSLWRASPDSGPMRYPQRFLEGEPFARRSRGGGILVDCSSSNSSAIAGLEETIKKLPNLWVGTHVGTAPNPPAGRVCVIAEKGRWGWIDNNEDNSGGNEGTDLPGLMLMVREASPPYIWVSDGEAWCRGSIHRQQQQQQTVRNPVDTYVLEVEAFCRKHRIVRVESLEDAREYALGGIVEVFEYPHTVWNRTRHNGGNRPQSTRRRR